MKSKIFLLFLLTTIFINSYSQSKTEYEKRYDYITNQFLKKLGINQNTLKSNSGNFTSLFNSLNLINLISTPQGIILMAQYDRELKSIEKYKTELDFSREKTKKDLEEKKKREKIKNQELKEKREEAEQMLKNSDKNIFEQKLSETIDLWLKKNEFESTSEFHLRINDNFKDFFNKACITNFNKFLNSKSKLINLKLDRYDADNEIYFVTIKSRSDYSQFQEQNDIEQQFRGYIKVSKNEAKELKEMYGSENPHYENWINGEDKVKCYVEDFKNVFFYYLPSKIKLYKSQENKSDYHLVYLDYKDEMLEEIKYRYTKDGETFGFDWDSYVSTRIQEIENKRNIEKKQLEITIIQEQENRDKFNLELLNQNKKLDSLFNLNLYNDYETSYKQIENLFSNLPKGVKESDFDLPTNKVKELKDNLINNYSELYRKFEYSKQKLWEEIRNDIFYGHNKQLSPKFKKIAQQYLDFLRNLYNLKVSEEKDLDNLLIREKYTKMWADFNVNFLKYYFENRKDKLKLLKDDPTEDIINQFNN